MTDGHSPSIHCKTEFRWGRGLAVVWLAGATFAAVSATAQDIERAPINYSAAKARNAITRLQERIDAGTAKLEFEPTHGYLRSLLRLLEVPESSQVLVFSKTSMQRERISPRTPRAIYYNDEVMVGFCRRGQVIEVSAADEAIGTAFYTLEQAREREGGSAASDRLLPALSQLVEQPGLSGASRPFPVRRHGRESAACQRLVPHRSRQSARRAVGRLVRDQAPAAVRSTWET